MHCVLLFSFHVNVEAKSSLWESARSGLMNSMAVDTSVKHSSHFWKSIFRASCFVIAQLSHSFFFSEIVAQQVASQERSVKPHTQFNVFYLNVLRFLVPSVYEHAAFPQFDL